MTVGLERRKRTTALLAFGLASVMVGAAFASVPLYRIFCQVTGYGGTTQVAEAAPVAVGERLITVRFDANIVGDLPWRFKPVAREVTLRVGESGLANYRAVNLLGKATVGQATYNVTPLKAGPYFNKIACFCFDEQRLAAGETAEMPVSFFVDPAISDDPNLDDVTTITLSYTFFPRPSDPDSGRAQARIGVFGDADAGGSGKTNVN